MTGAMMNVQMKYTDKYKVKRGKVLMFAPFRCVFCNKEIVTGEWYFNKRGHEAHVDCVKEKSDIIVK